MKRHHDAQKAAGRAAAELSSITMRESRVAILAMLQERDAVADGYGKRQEYQYELPAELRHDIRARLGTGQG